MWLTHLQMKSLQLNIMSQQLLKAITRDLRMHCHTVLRVMLKIMCSLSAGNQKQKQIRERNATHPVTVKSYQPVCYTRKLISFMSSHDVAFHSSHISTAHESKRNAWWEEPHPAVFYNIQSFIFYLVIGSRSLNSVKAS